MTATMKVTNLQNESSATPNIVLNADGTTTIPTQSTTNLSYTGTLTGGTGVINIGSGQVYKDTAGNLGLGVTPSAWQTGYKALQIGATGALWQPTSGYTFLSDNAYVDSGTINRYITTNFATLYRQQSGQHNWFTAPSGTAGNAITFTQAMTLDASGNLLVGTTTAGYSSSGRGLIEINGTTALLGFKTGNVNRGYLYTQGTDMIAWAETGSFTVGTAAGANIQFSTSNTEVARFDSGGRFIVGATAPHDGSAKIQAEMSGANTGITTKSGSTGTAYAMGFYNPNGLIGGIVTNGTSTSYNTSSDYRLKENVAPMTGALAKVSQLKPCTYTWKADGSAGQGFIAHELQAVVPDAVTGEKDAVDADGNPKYQGVDTSFLVATLAAAIQEQQEIITQLQADVAALKGAA